MEKSTGGISVKETFDNMNLKTIDNCRSKDIGLASHKFLNHVCASRVMIESKQGGFP